ncbi:serine--tRNA ligase [Streptomonospora nanhaiensis]|uniref:Serine--tRNA ligase n=1 Tax=Streptomonospora nanhaiensis TaxID=1323731 RepID=A0A853BQA8_9ACTN|nr:serine--tRNA ligase [Streptomonospora nanhaiensis]MBV2364306.1 serine--tRNA ligase [Streptomonospora nanhaiensis]MBX9391548.1 serine--tRNA ligase [Streptomonospora nanhaiensis]NYI97190.1 seryl-tRNA synthetase [Streptomonospora nanhaiensis]
MIDLRALRDSPDRLRASQRVRGEDDAVVDRLLDLDSRHRAALTRFEGLRAEQKSVGKSVSAAAPEERESLLARAKELAAEVKRAEAEAGELSADLDRLLREVPNIVEDDTPVGGVDDFVVVEEVGTPREFDFTPRDHLELGELLGAIDTDRGAKVSGARFYFLTGVGAQLELALLNLAMQQAAANGFTPMIPPVLVKPETMDGTGFLGAHADEVYRLEADDLYLVGTSEVPLAGYHAGEILPAESLPTRYVGWSPCFRREAGSYGKDTRGIIRVHQFNKVEMFVYTHPDHAHEEHLRLLAWEREMLDKLELPYRVVDIAGGDLGASAARKYDCEAWVPTQGRYRELTSTSNCTDFQARRLNIRFRDDSGKPRHAATLNGTLATTRWIVALLENHQRADGSVVVPEALRPFVGRDVLEPVKK